MLRIAVIADLHYSQTVITTCRVKRWGHAIPGLLDTALQKLNRETQPDVLLRCQVQQIFQKNGLIDAVPVCTERVDMPVAVDRGR